MTPSSPTQAPQGYDVTAERAVKYLLELACLRETSPGEKECSESSQASFYREPEP